MANGASYEYYIGLWSKLVARQFITWPNITLGAEWLDVGCGTGTLSQIILDIASPKTVVGIDSSKGYIEFTRKQIQDPRVFFTLGDAQLLQLNQPHMMQPSPDRA